MLENLVQNPLVLAFLVGFAVGVWATVYFVQQLNGARGPRHTGRRGW